MKLAVFINQEFCIYNKQASTYLSFIKFIESFLEYFALIKIFAPVKHVVKNDQCQYFCANRILLCEIPYYDNVKELARKGHFILPRTVSVLKRELLGVELLWIVGPHPLGLVAGYYAKKNNIRTFLHIRGNILNDVKARYNNSLVGRFYAGYMHFSNRFLSKRMTTFVVGTELYNLYKDGAKDIFWFSPSLIEEKDINESKILLLEQNNFVKLQIKLLFVGRIEPEKGLLYLFQALQDLQKDQDVRYELIIVGCAQRGSEEKEIEIKRAAVKLGIDQYITWKGYIPYGDELKKIYRLADIFILPSLAEGIPKVIYEAMAFGLPIVSTDVGGIPDVIKHQYNGILIKSKSKDEIVAAVKSLTKQNNLRKFFIENGLQEAEKYTIESARQRIISLVNSK